MTAAMLIAYAATGTSRLTNPTRPTVPAHTLPLPSPARPCAQAQGAPC